MTPLEQTIKSSPFVKIFLTVSIFTIILAILPSTPFSSFLQQMAELPYLNYINWIIPIGRCAAVMAAWWTCVVVYYAVRWILGQLHIVGGN